MSLLKYVMGLAVAATLTACGGGGGSAGGTPDTGPGTGTGTSTTATPTIAVGLSGGGSSIEASGSSVALATVKDASGALVSGKLVTFSGDPIKVKFSPASGQVLTVNGVASIQVIPASLAAEGAGTLVAESTLGGETVSDQMDFQLAAANLGLLPLDLGAGPLAANGNRAISVKATVNNLAATNTPVQVTFNASCGTVTPAVVTTDSTGSAAATYTASVASCAGTNVTITGSAVGATSVSGTIAVAAAIATNVKFVSTTPQLIYLKDSVGATQAQVVFKVVDSIDNPLQNKKLRLSLSNSATGVSLNTIGNTDPFVYTTDSNGLVSAAVFSGTIPTSLNVKAVLLDNSNADTSVFSNSNLLTVASGRPTQRSLSLAVEKFSIEAKNIDGETTTLTLSMADRQGNPVPAGTQVNFVSETGVILPAVCFVPPPIPATETSPAIPVSSCTVTFRSQGTRTANGRVSILAYVEGEEDFVDADGNNVFSDKDPFTDLGRAFRDDNGQLGANDKFDSGEFQVPRLGASPCENGAARCVGDGVWGAADVRQQTTVVFASGAATIIGTYLAQEQLLPAVPASTGPPAVAAQPASMVTPGVVLTISDVNNNSVPTGSKIDISAVDNTTGAPVTNRTGPEFGTCTVVGEPSVNVTNALGSLTRTVDLKNCAAGDWISVKVTTPLGFITSRNLVIP